MALTNLRALRDDMERCFRCSLCKMVPLPVARDSRFTDACPASRAYHFHGYSPSGKQIMALSLLDGRIQPDRKMAEIVFACTACGYGDVACKFIMDAERHKVNIALREYLVEEGLGLAQHRKLCENLVQFGHPDGYQQRPAGAWAQGLPLKRLPYETAEVLLFAGCMQRSDARATHTVRRFAELLLHAGVEVGILGDEERCCGLPAYWTGHRDVFSRMAEDAISLLSHLGTRTIVTASGSCLGAFRSKYPEYVRALSAEVLHSTEMLCRLIQQGRLRLRHPVPARVTYHDPCYLGRQSEPPPQWEGEEKVALGCMNYTDPPKPVNRGVTGVYDPPRTLLGLIDGMDFVEMHRIREYAFCCGAGGGAPQAYPGMARSAALHRLEEARAVGAERVVTACPHCETHLTNAQDSLTSSPLPIVDIVDLVYEAVAIQK